MLLKEAAIILSHRMCDISIIWYWYWYWWSDVECFIYFYWCTGIFLQCIFELSRYRLRANVLFWAKSSTSMCTWAINTEIDHYNRLGRPIFSCSMYLSKAFDMVSWAKLYPKLLKRKISHLILRCLIHICSYQMCNVRGGNLIS